jgi:hypothetical protein
MGGSVALAHDGGGHGNGNGNGNGALAPTIFTMPTADGNPEGVAFDKKSGRFFVSRTGTGAIFSGPRQHDAAAVHRGRRVDRIADRDRPEGPRGPAVRRGREHRADSGL